MSITLWMACFLHVTLTATLTKSARILAIMPIPSYSHQITFRPLWIALSRRGHEVVVLTTDPMNDSNLTKLTEINFQFNYELIKQAELVKNCHSSSFSAIFLNNTARNLSIKLGESIFKHPEVRKMYAPNSGQKFDVVFAETIYISSVYALAHRFNAPIIGISSLGLLSNVYYLLGAPVLASHSSTWELENETFNPSLWQRIKNFILQWRYIYFIVNYYMPQQQAIAEKYLGKDIPDVRDMERNISIVFCNQQDAISFTRPKTPNIISFGNFHISKKLAALPKELKEFVDDAPNGFIYVSLGSHIVMSALPKYVYNVFRDVLTNLPCKVVWKLDIELPNKTGNIYVDRWFPQQSILAHRNIRLFVYQGGYQSTEEAVHYAVPVLGIPLLSDQKSQIKKMVSLGVGKRLIITDISREEMNASILKILNDKRYKERMLEVKALNEDKPYDSLENAVWWTEFVIRHKGAPHLHTDIADQPWYQKYDMDVIAILSVTIFATCLLCALITYNLLKMIFKHYKETLNDLKKKIN